MILNEIRFNILKEYLEKGLHNKSPNLESVLSFLKHWYFKWVRINQEDYERCLGSAENVNKFQWMEEQVVCLWKLQWMFPQNLWELNFRINTNQSRKRQSKSHNSSKAADSRVQPDCVYESIQRKGYPHGLGYGGLQRTKAKVDTPTCLKGSNG